MNDVLRGALQTGNIAGAYLVEGASADSILAQVDAFLMRLYCDEKAACGKCGGCIKYKNKTHADLLVIETDAKTIKVDAVREIAPFVYRKAFEGGWKAVLILQADKMTDQAQNALLKVLEEPPDDTIFVLGAADSKYLLPTILSRCIILRACKSDENAIFTLMEEFSLPTVKARTLLAVADGDYYLAKKYAEQDYFALRADMMLMLSRLFGARSMATSATEKLALKYADTMEEAFAIALLYLKDVISYKYMGNAEFVANADVLPEIEKHAQESAEMLINTADILAKFLQECELCQGVNKKLLLTGMLFDILGVRLGENK